MKFLRILAVGLAALLVPVAAQAQATLRATSLSAAVAISDASIVVASATGIEAGDVVYADREAMKVRSISGTRLYVARGIAGHQTAHASGAHVYVDDPTYFTSVDKPAGAPCTSTSEIVLPVVNTDTGRIWNCIDSIWYAEREFGKFQPKFVVTTDTTAAALTYTAAMLKGGLILRDPNGSGRSDVTPTAALLVASIPGAKVGDSFEFTVRNTADAAETITLTAGTGATLSGTMTIAQSNSKRFRVVLTSLTAYTVYSLGTVVH